MTRCRYAIFLIIVGCSAASLGADGALGNLRLYVGNSRGDDVSVVNMGSLKVVGDIKAGNKIHGVCVQPDGKRLFVTVESDHTLRIIDTKTEATVATSA